MTVETYNKYLQEQYEISGNIDTLIKLVISETLIPIADYENAIRIIRNNYHKSLNSTLLIVGSYLLSEWSSDENEMLNMLNEMYPFLSQKEKSIISYLNARQIRSNDKNYRLNNAYKKHLLNSVDANTPFVFNRIWLSELVSKEDAKALKQEAISNIKKVYESTNDDDISPFNLTEPDCFINEQILGTEISCEVRKWIECFPISNL